MTNKDKGMPLLEGGASQSTVARVCGISRQAVHQWVKPEVRRRRRARLAAERAMRRIMCDTLNVKVGKIVEEATFQQPTRWQRLLRWLGF